ncbi:MaoC family dehydratase [Burkholderia ubonensis]|uniref:MaoC family dehydratase n=1 Tax=Burkholderia ubonensis TaxID=101571 RepID=UPI0007586E5A|nr:MaoC family dehydratase [Burkholderia ubonensis]AOI71769.1 dehydratase [Burkholderia ubonensis]KUZ19926.1 dehydratase [Burkholderia ubonensis]KUZ36438.1 dehydratase [Burkholderia ubonensis]KUZ40011.1 dehydratase [Burkholderia ubonensis]KUZ42551.1 dehydratase [Burkholderia ubonensis]
MNTHAGYTRIAANRYREDKGFHYDDFVVGETIEHRPGRTITATDNVWQSLIAMNQHPLHIESEFANRTEFGELLVSSLVTFNIVNGMTVHTISQKGIANLGWDEVRLLAPVFVGDTLYAETEILDKRLSRSRAGQGIVTVRTTGTRQDGAAVITFKRTILIPQRAALT